MRTERELKIHEMSGYHYKPTPTILLKGQWLSAFGFKAGNRIKVCCERGCITIKPLTEERPQSQYDSGAGIEEVIRR